MHCFSGKGCTELPESVHYWVGILKGWKNTGTGTNPDETVANIGVYGGPYAWGNWSNQPEEPEIPQNKTLKIVLEPTEKLQLSVNDDIESNADIIWTTSDESIASVDTTGLVNALKAGNATITVTSKDSKYTSDIKILVVNNADKYRLSIDLNIGETCRLTVDDATDTIPTIWTSSDPSVAAISEKGKVTATDKGLTIMAATDSEGTIIGQVYIRIR